MHPLRAEREAMCLGVAPARHRIEAGQDKTGVVVEWDPRPDRRAGGGPSWHVVDPLAHGDARRTNKMAKTKKESTATETRVTSAARLASKSKAGLLKRDGARLRLTPTIREHRLPAPSASGLIWAEEPCIVQKAADRGCCNPSCHSGVV